MAPIRSPTRVPVSRAGWLSFLEGARQGVTGVGGEQRGRPSPAVEKLPDAGHALARREQPPSEHPAPFPRLARQPQPHRRGSPVRPALGPALDEVPPYGGQEHPLEHGVQTPAESDALPAPVRQRVAQDLVEQVCGEQRAVAHPRFGGARRAPAGAGRVGVALEEDAPRVRMRGDRPIVSLVSIPPQHESRPREAPAARAGRECGGWIRCSRRGSDAMDGSATVGPAAACGGRRADGERASNKSACRPSRAARRDTVEGAQPRERATCRWADPATSPAATGRISSGRLR